MAITASDSVFPIVRAANKIVSITRSSRQMNATKKSYTDFVEFIGIETNKLKSIRFDERKIKKIRSLNVATSFGRSGNLLSSLASGALDAASFVGDFFSRNRKVKPKSALGKPVPKGPKIKLGGVRALGVANALFAGLDFATGLAEGEGVGKAAAGAGGSLAGSLLGGAIGQALIPVPGLGFVIGSAVGGMAGGWLSDRAYEGGEKAISALSGRESLKEQEQKQKRKAQVVSSQVTFAGTIDKFESVISQFENYVYSSFGRVANAAASIVGEEQNLEFGATYPKDQQAPGEGNAEYTEVTASGGKLPSTAIKTSGFGLRWGREHQGNDYAGPGVDNQPISVIQPGTVGYVGYLGSAGNAVVIDHPDGTVTKYFHLMDGSIKVSQGQKIEPGQVIGNVGNTGRSTGTHLHFEVWKNGSPIDPSNYADNYFRFGGNVKVKRKDKKTSSVTSGQPVIVATGTNDYMDPKKVEVDTKKILEELRNKGYTPILVPPNKDLSSAAHEASIRAADSMGVGVEKGIYDSSDKLHLTMDSAKNLRNKYSGAEIIGDSNAVRIAGGSNVKGKRVVGAGGSDILQYAIGLVKTSTSKPQQEPTVVPQRQQYLPPQQIQEMQQYPSYNIQSETVTLIPISQGSNNTPMVVSSGGGSETVILPGPSDSKVLNSLFKTMLLTNLSST